MAKKTISKDDERLVQRTVMNYDGSLRPTLELWDKSKYFDRRLQRRNIKGGPPRFLYKYYGFDGKFDKTNLEDWIVNSAFRLSKPIEFNDPFDFHGVMVLEGTDEQFRERCFNIAKENMPQGSTDEEIERAAKFMSRNPAALERQAQERFNRERTTAGVACFSTEPKTVILWSHYAAGHAGVCLQFDVAHDFPALISAVKVRIVEGLQLPTMNWITTLRKDIGDVMLRKNSWWAHERERRIIQTDQGGKYVGLRPEALSRIILGCRIGTADTEFIDALLAKRAARGLPPIEVYVASPHDKLAKLVVRRRAAS
jgi:hypothetical protein